MLERRRPARFVYAPNYWQWFSHHQQHDTLPPELAGCRTQLDLIRCLGLDVLSRNVYCDQRRCWFGGLAEAVYDGIEVTATERSEGRDLVLERTFHTPAGDLHERQRYTFGQSTLVQEKFLIDDYARQFEALEKFLDARRWPFPERYQAAQQQVGSQGLVMAGELHSPLKMLHFTMGPEKTTYLLVDMPGRAAELLARHEAAQLNLVGRWPRPG